MAMEDEKYVFFQDVREKKTTGYSARKQKKHGKGGSVKLPSDYLTKKELKNMSGECKTYRMNSPMKWPEFKAMPKDLQIAYIKAIKEKYNPPVVAIAKMMDADRANFSRYLISLGFEKQKTGKRSWDKMGFAEWCYGLPKTEECQSVQEEVKEEIPVEEGEQTEEVTIAEDDLPWNMPVEEETEPAPEPVHRTYVSLDSLKAVPQTGSLTFTGNATQIMNTLVNLLGNAKVMLSVNWDVVED
jgi:hypothetical protein